MVIFELYELDNKSNIKLIDSKKSLNDLCEKHNIPNKDVAFALRVTGGEHAYNNLLIKAVKSP